MDADEWAGAPHGGAPEIAAVVEKLRAALAGEETG